ncbi:MAG: hypothetical protein EBS23_00785 [Betaproteobacteria bacterium]|nr:hypothetical protein [Betaproteobacteria bacterium]
MTNQNTEQHRTIILTTRVNPEEHALIIEAAARTNLPPATYLRAAALNARLVVRTFATMAPEDLAQLKRLGNLLNQIARSGWRGRFTRPTEELHARVMLELLTVIRRLGSTKSPSA